jgi:hypothetical protein
VPLRRTKSYARSAANAQQRVRKLVSTVQGCQSRCFRCLSISCSLRTFVRCPAARQTIASSARAIFVSLYKQSRQALKPCSLPTKHVFNCVYSKNHLTICDICLPQAERLSHAHESAEHTKTRTVNAVYVQNFTIVAQQPWRLARRAARTGPA